MGLTMKLTIMALGLVSMAIVSEGVTPLNCYFLGDKGQLSYRGNQQYSDNGEKCLFWDDYIQHVDVFRNLEYREKVREQEGTAHIDFCRNPFMEWAGPSCFTKSGLKACTTNVPPCTEACSQNPSFCKNGGNCTVWEDNRGYTCGCASGFQGQYCEINIDDCGNHTCLNGATCMDQTNSYNCSCAPGFTGDNCETNINECQTTVVNGTSTPPCANGGTCIDGVNGYNCTCAPGYMGNTCEINIDECASNPCANNGTCVDANNAFTCTCQPGWTGPTCAADLNECLSNPCQNGATCTDQFNNYTCACAAGWTGSDCTTNINECSSSPCQNGGTCVDGVNSFTCTCTTGYGGATCQTEMCASASPCQNGGTCVPAKNNNGYNCTCVAGYSGEQCQTDTNECASSPCQNGGTCTDGLNSFSCTCRSGFSGTDCSTDINECLSTPCQNGGTCQDLQGGYVCACATGYFGINCQSSYGNCRSNPCQNGGTCTDGPTYSCTCPSGTSGSNCQTVNDNKFMDTQCYFLMCNGSSEKCVTETAQGNDQSKYTFCTRPSAGYCNVKKVTNNGAVSYEAGCSNTCQVRFEERAGTRTSETLVCCRDARCNGQDAAFAFLYASAPRSSIGNAFLSITTLITIITSSIL